MADMPERTFPKAGVSVPSGADDNPWVKRLWRMKKYQEKHSANWVRNEKLLFGELFNLKVGAAFKGLRGHPKNAYGWGLFKLLESEIYVQNPSCKVRAFLEQLNEVGYLLEQAIAYDLEMENVRGIGSLILIDNFITGYGCLMETVETPRTVLRFPNPETGKPDEVPLIEDQHFKWRRVHPADFVVDPRSLRIDLADARYIGVRFFPTLTELRDDKSFSLPEDINLYPESHTTDLVEGHRDSTRSFGETATQAEEDADYRQIGVWELHDNVKKKLVYVTDHKHSVIKEAEVPYDLQFGSRRLFPLTVMAMHTQPRTWYPRAEVDLVAAQLEEINLIDALMTRDTLTKWRKTLMLGELVSKEEAKKLASPDLLHSLVVVDPTKAAGIAGVPDQTPPDIRRYVMQLEDPVMPRDLPTRRAILHEDIQHTLGYGPADRGGMPSTRTAREAVFIHSRQEQKLATRLEAVNLFYKDVMSKHARLLGQLGIMKRYARLVNSVTGLTIYQEFVGSKLPKGEFDFEIMPGSSGPRTSEQKRAEDLNLFQIMAPVYVQQGKSIDPLIRRLLRWWGEDRGSDFTNNEAALAEQLAIALAYFRVGKAAAPDVLKAASDFIMARMTPPPLIAIQKKIAEQTAGISMLQGATFAGSGEEPRAATGRPLPGDPNAAATAAGAPTTGKENVS